MSPQSIRPKVPGFHDYHSNLRETMDWCEQELARQNDQYARLRPRLLQRVDGAPEHELLMLGMDLKAINAEATAVNDQLTAALSDSARVLPVYRLLRLLTKRGGILGDLQRLLDS